MALPPPFCHGCAQRPSLPCQHLNVLSDPGPRSVYKHNRIKRSLPIIFSQWLIRFLSSKKVTSSPCSHSWSLPLSLPPSWEYPQGQHTADKRSSLSYTSSSILKIFFWHFEMWSHNTGSGAVNVIYERARLLPSLMHPLPPLLP